MCTSFRVTQQFGAWQDLPCKLCIIGIKCIEFVKLAEPSDVADLSIITVRQVLQIFNLSGKMHVAESTDKTVL